MLDAAPIGENPYAGRISPGLSQTLISSAYTVLTRLRESDKYTYAQKVLLGLDSIPSTGSGMFDWLLVGENSILASAAYVRYDAPYTQYRKGKGLDLPQICSSYNAGSYNDGSLKPGTNSPFGLLIYDNLYISRASRGFNVMRDKVIANSAPTGCHFEKSK